MGCKNCTEKRIEYKVTRPVTFYYEYDSESYMIERCYHQLSEIHYIQSGIREKVKELTFENIQLRRTLLALEFEGIIYYNLKTKVLEKSGLKIIIYNNND